MLSFLAISALVLAVSQAAIPVVISFGSCPKYDPVPSINLTAYMGKWYEIQKYPAVFEIGMTCNYAHYNLVTDDQGSVSFRMKIEIYSEIGNNYPAKIE